MQSNEFWQGYHSFNNRVPVDDCPFRFQPVSARDWKKGHAKAMAESEIKANAVATFASGQSSNPHKDGTEAHAIWTAAWVKAKRDHYANT